MESALRFCGCVIDAQEIEFGNAEYEAMMAAEPNAEGTKMERRLFQTTNGCSGHLE